MSAPELYLLHECAAGFLLVVVKEWEQIGQTTDAVEEAAADASRFGQVVGFKAFRPFSDAEDALANINAIAKGEASDVLLQFLEENLPKKKKKYQLGLCDPGLAKALSDVGFPVCLDKSVLELQRGCRLHLKRILKQLGDRDMHKFQVGLGHAYSRCHIKFDPARQDKPVTQSIALIDAMDKNVNLFTMRLREWYGWHFPELVKVVPDGKMYAQAVTIIGMKEDLPANTDKVNRLRTLFGDADESVVDDIVNASKISMGQEMTDADWANIEAFAKQVFGMYHQRGNLGGYLEGRLRAVAPNLQALVGDLLAARLISHAGSLTSLSKYPASTVQIVGAEKALFRALKTKGNTPKYGLLFQSSFVGKAAQVNKGRISRYLANKCSLASRIDAFGSHDSDVPVFGEKMKEQVEERLRYLTDKVAPRKNIDVMADAVTEYENLRKVEGKKKKKKQKKQQADEAMEEEEEEEKAGGDGASIDISISSKGRAAGRKRAHLDSDATVEPEDKKKKKKKLAG